MSTYYCLDCVIKHLADAKVFQEESWMGYPDHILDTIGNLSQAARECFAASPELAEEIRQYRLMVMEDSKVEIPYYELYNKVKKIIAEKGCGSCKKANDSFKDRLKKRAEENKTT